MTEIVIITTCPVEIVHIATLDCFDHSLMKPGIHPTVGASWCDIFLLFLVQVRGCLDEAILEHSHPCVFEYYDKVV